MEDEFMKNIKKLSREERTILENGESILYTCKNILGNFEEKEVLKYNGKFYRIQATNKNTVEFLEV